MIVYYQKSTKKILTVANHDSKKHLETQEELEAELNSMFPDMEDDVGVSRFEETENTEASCGGIWDPEKNIQTAPPPVNINPDVYRLEELKAKLETQTATMAEVQEYLFKRG